MKGEELEVGEKRAEMAETDRISRGCKVQANLSRMEGKTQRVDWSQENKSGKPLNSHLRVEDGGDNLGRPNWSKSLTLLFLRRKTQTNLHDTRGVFILETKLTSSEV